MQCLTGRGRKTAYDVTGNVVWLARPAPARGRRSADPIASLKESVIRLTSQIERAERLKADIATAVDARRYELYKGSAGSDEHGPARALAGAQRMHVDSLLKFVHAIAAAGRDHAPRTSAPLAPSLARSIRELEASVERTRQLSRDVLAQCQRRDWRGGT